MSAAREWFNRTFPRCVDCGCREWPWSVFVFGTYREDREGTPNLRCAECHLAEVRREHLAWLRESNAIFAAARRRLREGPPNLRLIAGGKP